MTEHSHCDTHSGTVALLSEHSRAIADLYERRGGLDVLCVLYAYVVMQNYERGVK